MLWGDGRLKKAPLICVKLSCICLTLTPFHLLVPKSSDRTILPLFQTSHTTVPHHKHNALLWQHAIVAFGTSIPSMLSLTETALTDKRQFNLQLNGTVMINQLCITLKQLWDDGELLHIQDSSQLLLVKRSSISLVAHYYRLDIWKRAHSILQLPKLTWCLQVLFLICN